MSYTIKQLDESYNQQLITLSESSSTGSTFFNTDRLPDFFALSNEFGKTKYFGILKNDLLIGNVGVAEQYRNINREPVKSYYLFDMKIHPEWAGKTAFYRLMQYVVAHYKDVEKASWMFSTILDSNKNISALTKGANLFPKGRFAGKNYHVGFPLFLPLKPKNRSLNIAPLNSEDAWQFYEANIRNKQFAPRDKTVFLRNNGKFLAAFRENKIIAICKIVDQSQSRRIKLTGKPPLSFTLMNLLCRLQNCPPLPKQNQVFQHAYLSYYVAGDKQDYRPDFLHYIRKHFKEKYTYIFTGLTENESKKYSGKTLIKFSSSTYVYGDFPENISLDFAEITLI